MNHSFQYNTDMIPFLKISGIYHRGFFRWCVNFGGGGETAVGGGETAVGGGETAVGGGETAVGGGETAVAAVKRPWRR